MVRILKFWLIYTYLMYAVYIAIGVFEYLFTSAE
jgi:hypothetical protein